MKRTSKIAVLITVSILLVNLFMLPVSAINNEAGDYVVFDDGEFKNGGYIVENSGTIIKDNYLIGGEGLFNGEEGEGSFHIILGDNADRQLYTEYKYLVLICSAYNTETTTGGTIKLGDDIYNFDQLEITGKVMPSKEKITLYGLGLDKINEYTGNELILSAMSGYKVQKIWFSNHDPYVTDQIIPDTSTQLPLDSSGQPTTEPIPTESESTTEPITEPTTAPSTQLDVPTEPTQNIPTQTTSIDVIHPTATAPSDFYNNPVPNPNTDSGSIPAVAFALIGGALLLVGTKKK